MMPSRGDDRYLNQASRVALGSPCIVKVGGVLVSEIGDAVFCAYNAPASQQQFNSFSIPFSGGTCREWCPRSGLPVERKDTGYNDCPTVHAEMAVCVQAGHLAKRSTVYVNSSPCRQCAKLMVACGVSRLVCRTRQSTSTERHLPETVKYLQSCGVEVEVRFVEG